MMKYHCVTLFCVLFVLILTISSSEGKNCMPGKSYYDGCNHCHCIGGEAIRCTLIACPGNTRIPPPEEFWLPEEPILENIELPHPKERQCVSGKSHYNGCNTCNCNGGRLSCSYAFCPGTKLIPIPEDFWVPESDTRSLYEQVDADVWKPTGPVPLTRYL